MVNKIFKKNVKSEHAITLIALVITIIVLLILAGISISMLSGDNSILGRATDAKIKTERAQIEEAAKIAYASGVMDKYTAGGSGSDLQSVVDALKNQGYTTKSIPAGETTITGLKLQVNGSDITDVNIDKADGNLTVKVVPITSSGDTKSHYVQINGLWHEIKIENNDIVVSETGVKEVTGGEVDLSGKITATVADTTKATVPATISGDTIEITPVAKGNTTITISATGVTNSLIANLSVKELAKLKDINVATLTVDGASLITATLNDDSIATSSDVKWTSSNPSVATVTANGIVMSKGTGSATITCTGAENTTKTCEVNSLASIEYTNSGTTNTTVTGATTGFSYNNPVVPAGFSAVNTNDAKWSKLSTDYNKGLVIMDPKGNQFVWVPVDGTTVTYAKWCTNGSSSSDKTDDTLPTGISNEQTQIDTYKGFYVGRYESGLDVDLGSASQKNANSTHRNKNTINPIIVEGASPWNYIDYTYSKQNAERMYSNNAVQSGLLTGTQWDTTMRFIKDVGEKNGIEDNVNENSKGWGNYKDSVRTLDRYKMLSTNYGASWTAQTPASGETYPKTTNNSSQLLRTGSSTETKVLNISDMAGNLWEWTNECSSSVRMGRGGSYDYLASRSAGYRDDNSVYNTTNLIGFRVVLYVK